MNILTELQSLINEHGSSSILRERLSLFQDKFSQLEKKCSDLEKKLSNLHIENANLHKQLCEKVESEKFTEHRGALFKRDFSGRYDKSVFCPRCRRPLGSQDGFFNYTCHACNIVLDFNGNDLHEVLAELNKNKRTM